jgi:hypothetical protein
MIIDVQTPSGAVIPTCSIHWMAPCPCRVCMAHGDETKPCDPACERCSGDGCDPETRSDCERRPPIVTTASSIARRHVIGVFVDGYMVGWGPQSEALAEELRALSPQVSEALRDDVIASGEGIGGLGYTFGDGTPW